MYKYTVCIFWPIVHKGKWKHTTVLVLLSWCLKHRMGDFLNLVSTGLPRQKWIKISWLPFHCIIVNFNVASFHSQMKDVKQSKG